jgi:hypothetical protein
MNSLLLLFMARLTHQPLQAQFIAFPLASCEPSPAPMLVEETMIEECPPTALPKANTALRPGPIHFLTPASPAPLPVANAVIESTSSFDECPPTSMPLPPVPNPTRRPVANAVTRPGPIHFLIPAPPAPLPFANAATEPTPAYDVYEECPPTATPLPLVPIPTLRPVANTVVQPTPFYIWSFPPPPAPSPAANAEPAPDPTADAVLPMIPTFAGKGKGVPTADADAVIPIIPTFSGKGKGVPTADAVAVVPMIPTFSGKGKGVTTEDAIIPFIPTYDGKGKGKGKGNSESSAREDSGKGKGKGKGKGSGESTQSSTDFSLAESSDQHRSGSAGPLHADCVATCLFVSTATVALVAKQWL